ncbi:MAG: hypothetical protein ACRDL6_00860 [Solirubrobacterales bacterium]
MSEHEQQVTIRRLSHDDHENLVRLAQLDSSPAPEGELLGAVVDGGLVAAVSLSSGRSVANPFVPSAGVRSMLVLRAKQLSPKRSRLFPRRRRARGSLGAQPAGAGGRLLVLGRRG